MQRYVGRCIEQCMCVYTCVDYRVVYVRVQWYIVYIIMCIQYTLLKSICHIVWCTNIYIYGIYVSTCIYIQVEVQHFLFAASKHKVRYRYCSHYIFTTLNVIHDIHYYTICYTLYYTHYTQYTLYTILYIQVSEDSLEKLHATTSTTTIDNPNNNPPQTNGTTTGASSTRPKPNLKPPSHSTTPTQTKTTSILYSLYRQQHLRVLIISSIILQMCQQLCGINAVFYYSTTFFEGQYIQSIV